MLARNFPKARRKIYWHSELLKFQEFVYAAIHVMFSPGFTRWLAMRDCIVRVKEQIQPLKLYFTAELLDDPESETVSNVLNFLEGPLTFVYLQFLEYALGTMVDVTKVNLHRHTICPNVKEVIVDAKNFMHGHYVRSVKPFKVDPTLSSQYLLLEKLYLGSIKNILLML